MIDIATSGELVLDAERPIDFDRFGLLHIVLDDGQSLQMTHREFLNLFELGITMMLDLVESDGNEPVYEAHDFTRLEDRRLKQILNHLQQIGLSDVC